MRIIIRHTPTPDELKRALVGRIHLDDQPVVNNLHHVALLLLAKSPSLRDGMPLFQTPATAGSGGVLRNKHRMPTHWGLFTIVGYFSRSQPLADKIGGVLVNNVRPFIIAILPLLNAKAKSGAKSGTLKARK